MADVFCPLRRGHHTIQDFIQDMAEKILPIPPEIQMVVASIGLDAMQWSSPFVRGKRQRIPRICTFFFLFFSPAPLLSTQSFESQGTRSWVATIAIATSVSYHQHQDCPCQSLVRNKRPARDVMKCLNQGPPKGSKTCTMMSSPHIARNGGGRRNRNKVPERVEEKAQYLQVF